MGNADLAQSEREGLCDLMLEVGPDQATLCEGWTAAHLAAHLIVRERQPLAGPGMILGGPFARYTERTMDRLIASNSFEHLVERVRSGPPLLMRPLDGPVNLVEFFIHHEDLRRTMPNAEPRSDIEDVEEALWNQPSIRLKTMTFRLDNLDLTLRDPKRGEKHIGGGRRPVTIVGSIGEISLYLFGRRGAAQVELVGEPDACEELATGRLGI